MWVPDIPPPIRNFKIFDHKPVTGFEAIRIYYALEEDAIHVIRILHGKRDVRRLLQSDEYLPSKLRALMRASARTTV